MRNHHVLNNIVLLVFANKTRQQHTREVETPQNGFLLHQTSESKKSAQLARQREAKQRMANQRGAKHVRHEKGLVELFGQFECLLEWQKCETINE